jgi:hypothetical protein
VTAMHERSHAAVETDMTAATVKADMTARARGAHTAARPRRRVEGVQQRAQGKCRNDAGNENMSRHYTRSPCYHAASMRD